MVPRKSGEETTELTKGFGIAALVLAALASTTAEAQRSRGDPQKDAPKGERPPEARKVFPSKVSWVAMSLNGRPFAAERPTFVLDEQLRVRGFGGCNTFSAVAYPLSQQRFAVGPFALTKKACDKAVMDQERNFLIALRTSVQWDVQGPELVIRTQNGELRFQRSL
jgi:heat shock protein HslJ